MGLIIALSVVGVFIAGVLYGKRLPTKHGLVETPATYRVTWIKSGQHERDYYCGPDYRRAKARFNANVVPVGTQILLYVNGELHSRRVR